MPSDHWYLLAEPAPLPPDLGPNASIKALADKRSRLLVLDSFDWRLWDAKLVLLAGAGQLTLLRRTTGERLAQAEREPPRGDLHPAELPASLTPHLHALLEPRVLMPRLALDHHRHSYQVRDEQQKLLGQLHYQRLAAIADDNHEPAFARWALQIEPLKGYATELCALAVNGANDSVTGEAAKCGQLAAVLPLLQPLAEHGYRSKPLPPLAPDTPLAELLHDFLRLNLDCAAANLEGMLADRDPEFTHDYRVALRRARALLALLKGGFDKAAGRDLKQRLKSLASLTNDLRDLDVWRLESDAYATALPDCLQPGYRQLAPVLEQQRRQALRRVQKALASGEQRQTLQQLRAELAQPQPHWHGKRASEAAAHAASRVFATHSHQLAKLCQGIDKHTADEQLHAVRIECKKMRYLLELFRPIADDQASSSAIRRLKQLQDSLGRFNDLSVRQAFIGERLLSEPTLTRLSPAASAAAGGLLSLVQQQYRQQRRESVKTLRRAGKLLQQLQRQEIFLQPTDGGAANSLAPAAPAHKE